MERFTERTESGKATLKERFTLSENGEQIVERLALLEDKNEHKKADLGEYDAEADMFYLICPSCKEIVGSLDNEDGDGIYKYNVREKYCSNCGQKIEQTYTKEDYNKWGIK